MIFDCLILHSAAFDLDFPLRNIKRSHYIIKRLRFEVTKGLLSSAFV